MTGEILPSPVLVVKLKSGVVVVQFHFPGGAILLPRLSIGAGPRACPALGQPQGVAPTNLSETDPLPGAGAASLRSPFPRKSGWRVLERHADGPRGMAVSGVGREDWQWRCCGERADD